MSREAVETLRNQRVALQTRDRALKDFDVRDTIFAVYSPRTNGLHGTESNREKRFALRTCAPVTTEPGLNYSPSSGAAFALSSFLSLSLSLSLSFSSVFWNLSTFAVAQSADQDPMLKI